MKSARIVLRLVALLLAGLIWKFWPVNSTQNTPPSATVEPPKAAPARPGVAQPPAPLPTADNAANATVLELTKQDTLNDLLKLQTALEQSLSTTTDPQERDALEHELSGLQTQIQYEIRPSTTQPMATTDLGEIVLTEGHPVQKKLASGDEATLTVFTSADGSWLVTVIVRHAEPSGTAGVESTSVAVQPGQNAVIKVNGNEIHFTPKSDPKLLSH